MIRHNFLGLLILLAVAASYVFYWGAPVERIIAPDDIYAETGYGYNTPIRFYWPLLTRADHSFAPQQSVTRLFENGKPLGPGHQIHDVIRQLGQGRFSHWENGLWFSASDNSNPKANGRRYTVVYNLHVSRWVAIGGWATAALYALFLFRGPIGAALGGGARTIRARAGAIKPRRGPPDPVAIRAALRPMILTAAIAAAGAGAGIFASGVLFWITVGVVATAATLFVRYVLLILFLKLGWTTSFAVLKNAAIILASLAVCSAAIEGYLGFSEWRAVTAVANPGKAKAPAVRDKNPESAFNLPISFLPEAAAAKESRKGLLTMPEKWKKRLIKVEGATYAYDWHDVRHVVDTNGFRRTTPFPSKRKGVFRVLVVGDSLTYGEGVRNEWVYSSLLAREMSKKYNIEFFNLGVMGNQSEDVLEVVRRFQPALEPDLVIYGICLNDFLPSGIGEYNNLRAYPFPIPEAFKKYFLDRSSLARFFDNAYDGILRNAGLRVTFFDDILKDFKNYRARFASNLKDMNAFVTDKGLPPIMAMVLDQYPNFWGKGYEIAQVAEKSAKAAGMDVIPTEAYYRRYDGQALSVSPWEGHPDEEAHAIFAAMIRNRLEKRPDIERYRKGAN